MAYQVNEDKFNRGGSAIIHDDTSPFVNCHPQDKHSKNGQWYGPFLSKSDAWQCAKNTGRKVHGECANCLSGKKCERG